MVLCPACNLEYHGNYKKGCPTCLEKKEALEADLREKEETIEHLNKTLGEAGKGDAKSDAQLMAETMRDAMVASAEMAKAMKETMSSMQSMMKDLSLEIGKSRTASGGRDGTKFGGFQDGGRGSVPGDRHSADRFPRRSTMEDLWDTGDDNLDRPTLVEELLRQTEKRRSKFDIVRFLPEQDRKKTHPIESAEKLIVLLTLLIDDLEDRGEPTKGLRAHMIYVATMSSEGIYDLQALVSYDAAIRDKANKAKVLAGEDPFVGVDTALSNFHLGYAGTPHAKNIRSQNQHSNSHSRGRGAGRGGGRVGQSKQGFNGWKRLSSERGCCFSFSSGKPCEGCQYKHQCAYCNASDHGMLKCKQCDPGFLHAG